MPATKDFNFVELKNNRDRWLAQWMPQQSAKGFRGAFRGVSSDAKTRMSHCLAGCIVLDMRDAGRDINATKLESQAEWQSYVRTLFTTFESKPTCLVRAFKQEYRKVFGEHLSLHADPNGIILSTATRDYLKSGAMPPTLRDKMLTLRRKIGIIDQTIALLKSCVDDTRFGAMERYEVVNEGKLVRKVAEVREELLDEGFEAIARRHEPRTEDSGRTLSQVLQRLEELESTWHDTVEEPNPWFEQTSELYYRLCLKVLEAPKLSNVTTTTRLGSEVGATVTREQLENGLAAEARACGLLHAAIETEIVFEKAKLKFKAGVQAGGEVRARGEMTHATPESITNSLVSGSSPTLASVSGELEAWVGFKANAMFSLESDWMDVEAEGTVEGGAFGKASGKAEITATGASVALSLEAFVGLRASGRVKVRKKLFGFPVLEHVRETDGLVFAPGAADEVLRTVYALDRLVGIDR